MTKLTQYREQHNLTQEELAEKAGVSVRTIQRIEAGATPKGYTLKTLASVLGVAEDALRTTTPAESLPTPHLVKIINLSSLAFFILPFGNIILPLILMHYKKEVNTLTKQIVSVQILWTIISSVLIMLSPFIQKWFSLTRQLILIVIIVCVLTNLFIIIRNTVSLDQQNKLYIKLNFSFI